MDNDKISNDVKQNSNDLMPPVANPEKVKSYFFNSEPYFRLSV